MAHAQLLFDRLRIGTAVDLPRSVPNTVPMTTEHAVAVPAAGDDPAAAAASESDPMPASPPLPTRHAAAAPGPRAARLAELYASSMARTLAKVSWDNFAACYPTAAARSPAALRAVQTAMVERLRELCDVRFPACFLRRYRTC